MPGYNRNYGKYKRRGNYKKRGYYGNYGNTSTGGLAVRPKLMSRVTRWRRENSIDTKVFWFKMNGTINANDQPYQYYEFRTNFLAAGNPQGWACITQMYDQYKIMGFTYKLFPANVGTEPTASGPGAATIHFDRGNHIIWTDQRFDPNVVLPSSIADVINTGSARLINPRRPFTKSIWRPKGKYQWGSTRDLLTAGDAWTGSINHLINGATIQQPNQLRASFFYTLTFKVIVRGRQDD